jgi:hypothetical protein
VRLASLLLTLGDPIRGKTNSLSGGADLKSLVAALPLDKEERVIINSVDPLRALIQQSPILASIAAVFLLMCCASLVAFRRQQRRLAALQTQLDTLSHAIRNLEVAHEGLLLRFMNLPRSRKAQETSSPSSKTLKEEMVAPKQPDEKNLFVITSAGIAPSCVT